MFLKEIRKKIEKSLEKAPEGHLRTGSTRNGKMQFYLTGTADTEKYPNGKYIRKADYSLAAGLAQKEYDNKMLKEISRQENALEKAVDVYNPEKIKGILEKMPIGKRGLVVPYVLPDEEFVKEWLNTTIGGQNSYEFTESFTTENGEKVRSKSEKMIADKLLYQGIPYRYEAALRLKYSGIVYPDFTILNVRTRKTYFLEHCGMMDNEIYARKIIEKINKYEMNGIWPGEKLILTFESSKKPIDMNVISEIIDRYFL